MGKYTLQEVQVKVLQQLVNDYEAVHEHWSESKDPSLEKTLNDLNLSKDIIINIFDNLIENES